PGKNEVIGLLHPPNDYAISKKLGKVVRFEIFMYRPHKSESIYLDNICLFKDKVTPSVEKVSFRVAGTNLVVSGVQQLGKLFDKKWDKPTPGTVDQVEAEFKALHKELKKTSPDAVLAVFRDGEPGYDPAHPDKVFTGWKDAYWSSHGPDSMTVERARNYGKDASQEIFMRHRSPLMRVNLATIPKGSKILAAKLVIVRVNTKYDKGRNPEENPNMWVVEPCNRPWEEYEVNAYEYARDKFWKAIGGMYYGPDPDFLPIYLAHGPGGGKVSTWDLKEAVKFWTDGKHANHGFMLHGDSYDWMMAAHSREAKEVKDRPVVLVIYNPK